MSVGSIDTALSIDGRCPTFAKLTWGVTTTQQCRECGGPPRDEVRYLRQKVTLSMRCQEKPQISFDAVEKPEE